MVLTARTLPSFQLGPILSINRQKHDGMADFGAGPLEFSGMHELINAPEHCFDLWFVV
jgi:hypothetical protein